MQVVIHPMSPSSPTCSWHHNHVTWGYNDHGNKNEKTQAAAGAGAREHLTVLRSSVGKHCSLAHPHSFASPARSHAQNETETDFPIWSYCVDYFLSISDLTWVFGMMVVLAIFVLVLAMCWFFFFERVGAKA
jgi:hypothetical protein